MSGMFKGATSFNGDISTWDVSRVGNMKDMFRDAGSFTQHLCGAGWVQSNALKTGMFAGSSGSISREVCTSNRPTSRQVCRKKTRRRTLEQDPENVPVYMPLDEQLKIKAAEYLERYPRGDCSDCPEGAIGEWNISGVTDMSDLFNGAYMFNGDISEWDVSRVTNMNRMFMGATSFNRDLSKWDVSRVTDMTNMFTGAKAFKGDVSTWNVTNVGLMTDMFAGAQAFTTFDCERDNDTDTVR